MSSHLNSREAFAYIQGKVVNIVPTNDPSYNDKYDAASLAERTTNPLTKAVLLAEAKNNK